MTNYNQFVMNKDITSKKPTNRQHMTTNSCLKTIKVLHEHVNFMNGLLQKAKLHGEISNLDIVSNPYVFLPYYIPQNNNQHK